MSISVDCPSCGKNYSFKDDMGGRTVSCKKCGEDVVVPGGRRRGGKRKSSGTNPAIFIAVGIGVLAVVVFGGMAALKRGGNGAVNGNPEAAGGAAAPAAPDLGGEGGAAGNSRFNSAAVRNLGNGGIGVVGRVDPADVNPNAGVGMGSLVAVVSRFRHSSARANEYDALKEAPDVEPPQDWDVVVDAPKEEIDFSPAKKTVRVPIPNAKSSRFGRDTGEEDVIFPVVPSPFVAVGQNAAKKDVREIWDLSKPKKVGTITDLGVETTRNALSPDGKYFAGVTEGQNTTIGVWDVDAKKVLVDVPIESASSTWIPLLGIPSSNRLIIFTSWGGAKAQIFELPSGEPVTTVDFGWTRSDSLPVFSPNGKYFAWPKREAFWEQQIAFYSVETGEVAGVLDLPAYDVGFPLNVQGLAFSPNGEEIAAVIDGFSCSKIIIWKISDGSIADHITFKTNLRKTVLGDNALSFRTVNPLVFFPGGDRLLAYEHAIIDRPTGLIVWQIPRSNIVYGRKRWPLDRSYVTVMSLDGQVGSVVVYKLPEDKIADATAKAAAKFGVKSETPYHWVAPGLVSDPDRQTMQIVLQKSDVPWTVAVDPSRSPEPQARPRSFQAAKLPGAIQQVAVVGVDEPKAFVARSTADLWEPRLPKNNMAVSALSANRRQDSFRQGDGAFGSLSGKKRPRTWVDLYDVAKGKRIRELRLNYDGDMTSVSPDGSRFLILMGQNSGRLDVYSAKDGEHLAGWHPFDKDGGGDAAMVVSATFAGDDHVIALSGGGRLVAFHLPDLKAVWAANNASQPVVSAGGKYVGFSNGKSYGLVETATGALKGVVPDTGTVHAVAFRPDGKSIALLSEHANGYYLFTVDQATGRTADPFPVPILSAHLKWFGDRHLLLDHRKLVDVEQKVVAWSYDAPKEGDMIPSLGDGAEWYVTQSEGKAQFGGVPVPGPDAASTLANAKLSPEFVLQPGGTCSIDLSQLAHTGVDAKYKDELTTVWKKALAANDVKTAEGQPVTLVATVTETTGGPVTVQYGQRHFSSKNEPNVISVTYTTRMAECRIAFLVNGAPAWEISQATSIYHPWETRRSNAGDIVADMQKDFDASVRNVLKSFRLPPFVFTPRSSEGIGRTVLSDAN